MTDQQNPSRTRTQLGFRVAVALFVGLIVVCISMYVGWQNAVEAPAARIQQWMTQEELRSIGKAISTYQTRRGRPPQSINNLDQGGDLLITQAQSDGDGWRRPFIFSVSGTNAIAISYGRDGKPGGLGLDCDLSSTNWAPTEARPTLQQFFYGMPTGGMIKASIACGVLVFFLALFTLRVPALTRSALLYLVLKIILITIAAAFVATIITALHVPSGH